ncbi:MAG: diguanylate cyclase, partial [Pseudomonadota bacterium]
PADESSLTVPEPTTSEANRAKQDSAEARLMIDSVHDYAVFMLDPNGCVLSWNIGARRILGYEDREILGSHVSRFYPKEVQKMEPERALGLASDDRRYANEGWLVRRDGSRFWATVVIEPVRGADGADIGFAQVIRDTTERREALEALRKAKDELERRVEERTRELHALNAELERLADTDPLTGIYNRRGFLPVAKHELARSARYKTPLCMLCIDIDKFKDINDTFGHAAGDIALRMVVRQMEAQLRAGDVVARLGGDEFALLLLETDATAGAKVATRLCEEVASAVTPEGCVDFTVGISVGVAQWQSGETVDALLARADAALYRAKNRDRSGADAVWW